MTCNLRDHRGSNAGGVLLHCLPFSNRRSMSHIPRNSFVIRISSNRYLFLGFQMIHVNFRLLSPTDSGRASRSVVGNGNSRPISVARQKIDVGSRFWSEIRSTGAERNQFHGFKYVSLILARFVTCATGNQYLRVHRRRSIISTTK